MARSRGSRGAPATVFVFDIGGGSTEVIVGDPGGAISAAVSLDVGSVRMTERHVRSDPPRAEELDAIRADVRAALRGAPLPRGPVTVVGVAGTVTTLAAVALRVAPYEAARIHGARLTFAELSALRARLSALPLDERTKLPGLEPKRADVIVAGAVVAEEVLRAIAGTGGAVPELVVSDRGVRWGLALRLAASSPR
jgi:exopolyphosphatase/guanosine-5'-triphosphate,3'-diphosphate pyrophosphatase